MGNVEEDRGLAFILRFEGYVGTKTRKIIFKNQMTFELAFWIFDFMQIS